MQSARVEHRLLQNVNGGGNVHELAFGSDESIRDKLEQSLGFGLHCGR